MCIQMLSVVDVNASYANVREKMNGIISKNGISSSTKGAEKSGTYALCNDRVAISRSRYTFFQTSHDSLH